MNGVFPGKFRDANGLQPSWRVQFVQVDANANAAYVVTVSISTTTRIT